MRRPWDLSNSSSAEVLPLLALLPQALVPLSELVRGTEMPRAERIEAASDDSSPCMLPQVVLATRRWPTRTVLLLLLLLSADVYNDEKEVCTGHPDSVPLTAPVMDPSGLTSKAMPVMLSAARGLTLP
jgi:hypothetical protein